MDIFGSIKKVQRLSKALVVSRVGHQAIGCSKRFLPYILGEGKDIVRHSWKQERYLASIITVSEDRIGAILSKDKNKTLEFSQNFDG